LLVEDEPLAQRYCQMMLQGRGYHLDIASTGKIAMEYVNRHRYQSILMDVGLPDASGIELTRIIRRGDSANKDVPIIALTAHIDKSKQDECIGAGMEAFLNKPISPHALCEVLNQFAFA
ncbi:MAG: response regulator, partial [Pseudomonadota bacterium]|nr:response regulator [Pseudomonadota bacterium]